MPRSSGIALQIAISVILTISFCSWAWFVRADQFLSALLTNVGTTFLGLASGLFVLNFYLNPRTQRDAVAAVLRWAYPSFLERHNRFRKDIWNAIGQTTVTELLQSFAECELDASRLAEDQRKVVADIARGSEAAYKGDFLEIDNILADMQQLFGWTFDKEY